MDESKSVAIFTQAAKMLAEADTIQKAKELKSLALTAAEWAKRKGLGEEAIQYARSYALEAEIKMGEMLAQTERAKGTDRAGRPKKIDSTRELPSNPQPTLSELGIGKKESSRAQKLAALPQAKKQELRTGKKPIKQILAEVKQEKKHALAEQIRQEPVKPPTGRHRVIVIDPPWKYDNRVEDTTHRGRNQYPDMSIEEICALPVKSFAEDDCVLWLWTTNAFMRDAFKCLDAWGFKDKTILTWDKVNLGLGDYLRNVTEHCILAVRGKPILQLTNQTTIIREKRREHSRKPDAFYDLVEALCPGSKLEMFSREPREGWQQWGAETEVFKNVG
jgi:N6-adenosine-specific RNA methylase IME4